MVETAARRKATPWRCGKSVGLSSSAPNEPKPPIQTMTKTVEEMPATGSAAGSTWARYHKKEAATSITRTRGRAATPLLYVSIISERVGHQSEQGGRVVLGGAEGGEPLGGRQEHDDRDEDHGGQGAEVGADQDQDPEGEPEPQASCMLRPEVPPVLAFGASSFRRLVRGARTRGCGGTGGTNRESAESKELGAGAPAQEHR